MKYCKNCGHQIRRQKGVYKHRMYIPNAGFQGACILNVYCTNRKRRNREDIVGVICRCEKPEEQ